MLPSYKNYDNFYELNKASFDEVQQAKTRLLSPAELGQANGFVLAEAENLAFEFLNLKNKCSDLLFGLSRSVSDAKVRYKNSEGLFFVQSMLKSAAEKSKAVLCDTKYIENNQDYNSLEDLHLYLNNKRADFESNHYYYKGLIKGNQ